MAKSPVNRVVTLRCFDSIDLTDVWVTRRRTQPFDRNRPTMLVIGTAIEDRDPHAARAEQEDARTDDYSQIAMRLGERGYHVLNNACPGIPNLIMEAFTRQEHSGLGVELSILRSPHATDSDRAFSPTGFPTNGDLTVFCNVGFELLSSLNARCADCVLVIGGGLGSLLEAAACVMSGLPVICFTAAAGVATEIGAVFSRYKTRYKTLDVTTCDDIAELDAAFASRAQKFREAGNPTRLSLLIDEIHDAEAREQHLDICVAAGLASLTYSTAGAQVRVDHPRLIVDPRGIPDSHPDHPTLTYAMQNFARRYRHDEICLQMTASQIAALWGPSIDTFILIDVLREALANRTPRSAIDIGCGAGFVALWLASHGGSADICGIDPDADAIHCARINAEQQGLGTPPAFRVARLEECEPQGNFDLLVCNPPYLPKPAGYDGDFAYGGTALLRFLLSNYRSFLAPAGACYVTVSSLSHRDAVVRQALEAITQAGKGFCTRRQKVPFKVDAVLADPCWKDFLFPDRGAGLADDGFQHEVEVWLLYA